ncbi:MAG: hypothetical protein A2020_05270 [Lentisphaerae bacterium GWF2_45_14]|nr:MAG: hypothetical protein A2020_05270 [Lentisphaerae bacterium GWF2_45_14]
MLKTTGQNVFIRFFIPVFASFFIFVTIIFGFLIPRFKESIIDQKKTQCRENTHIAYSVIQRLYLLSQRGEMTTQEAKSQAFAYIKDLHYGPADDNYFWINDSISGTVIMHPYLDLKDQKNLTVLRDIAEKLVRETKGKEEAFVKCDWFANADISKTLEELTFIKVFKPWNWQIGTGLYLEGVQKEVSGLVRQQIIVCISALVIILLISIFVILQAEKSESRLRAAKRELEIKEKKYRDLFEKSGDAVFIFDDAFSFADCNDAAVKMFGYESKSKMMKHPAALSPQFQQDGRNSYEKADMILNEVVRERKTLSFEWTHQKKDGSLFPVDVILTGIDLEDGRIFLYASLRDITLRKESERKIKEYRERLEELVKQRTSELEKVNSILNQELTAHKKLESDIRQILDSAGDAMRGIALNHDVLYVNKRFSDITGIPKEKLIGSKCSDYFSDESCGTEHCALNIVIRGKEAIEREVIKTVPDGRKLTFLQTCAPYFTPNGEIIGIVENFKDITERKKTEAFEKQSAVQRGRIDMANNILHDIGNAITSIGTNSVRISSEQDWEEFHSLNQLSAFLGASAEALASALGAEKAGYLRKYVEILNENLHNRSTRYREILSKITKSVFHINSILDLQRTYARGVVVANGKLDMIKLVGDALFMLSSSFGKRNIMIKTDIRVKSLVIFGDHTRMLQAFINILKNACEAFDELEEDRDEGRYLKVGICRDGNQIRIEIEDNATGFDPASAETFFDKGFTTKDRDSGLGLYECREIIESHNGTIRMESDGKGTGAKVIIELEAENNKSKNNSHGDEMA